MNWNAISLDVGARGRRLARLLGVCRSISRYMTTPNLPNYAVVLWQAWRYFVPPVSLLDADIAFVDQVFRTRANIRSSRPKGPWGANR